MIPSHLQNALGLELASARESHRSFTHVFVRAEHGEQLLIVLAEGGPLVPLGVLVDQLDEADDLALVVVK